MLIPKALITIQNTLAVNPTEENLIKYFSEEGLDSIQDILEFYDNNWDEILRRWFVGSFYSSSFIKQNFDNGIFRFDSDNNEENIEIIDEEEFQNLKNKGSIY
jgi:hypothetical protein